MATVRTVSNPDPLRVDPNAKNVTKAKVKVSTLVKEAGWVGEEGRTMTAIILCEMPRLNAKGEVVCEANFAGCCWGIAQINRNAWPVSKEVACDPQAALKYAHDNIYKGSFTPWECFTNGHYRSQLGKDREITINRLAGATVLPETDDEGKTKPFAKVPSVAEAIGGEAIKLLSQLFSADTWFRIGKVVFGGLILVMAIEVLMKKAGVSSPIPKVVPIPV